MNVKKKLISFSVIFFFLVCCCLYVYAACTQAAYNPTYWNNNATTKNNNNCYNYAMNTVTNTYAQPGKATYGTTCNSCCWSTDGYVANLALADLATSSMGLSKTTSAASCPSGQTKIMLAVSTTNQDYHWYRHDVGGGWSHKMGGTEATNQTYYGSGVVITSPDAAAYAIGYNSFHQYFCYCGSSTQGGAGAPIQ